MLTSFASCINFFSGCCSPPTSGIICDYYFFNCWVQSRKRVDNVWCYKDCSLRSHKGICSSFFFVIFHFVCFMTGGMYHGYPKEGSSRVSQTAQQGKAQQRAMTAAGARWTGCGPIPRPANRYGHMALSRPPARRHGRMHPASTEPEPDLVIREGKGRGRPRESIQCALERCDVHASLRAQPDD